MPCNNSIQHSKYLMVLLALRAPKSCIMHSCFHTDNYYCKSDPYFHCTQCFAYKALVYCAHAFIQILELLERDECQVKKHARMSSKELTLC